ncbi:putative UDP-glucuronosyl/UDP-glucosyltransferase, UDP-glycosyltransferase family [Helianthus annuus]|uniref:Glycosyltransferase n=2 Tax=Helianthus annuus TaxID=4232 RepID=A0A251TEU3_HELAN|nr:putative UDP-glucuronosyl/UDP-glucosyltransferase, UDP-glycosyltransferase family [Helianthus annuus]KAJ0519310.1 putative UDP-glucuronosyl/UDP-glucosyltransferase, UDP-glycosyltransferase family [Helianthus annuus]KAJ0691106.1 putative UDP-glucuronosyl/UDP-glucosyltransferase, UDP-glycosyltransferase family [Helianthus annuus]
MKNTFCMLNVLHAFHDNNLIKQSLLNRYKSVTTKQYPKDKNFISSEKHTSTMIPTGDDLHIVFLPKLTSSHMIPLVNAARVFAARGVRSTIITTVHNALLFQASVDRDTAAGHPISIHTVTFPSSEVGLPVGMEAISSAPTQEIAGAVFRGMMMLQPTFEQVIRDLVPDCILSDLFYPWTVDLADELKIPRLMFQPSSAFSLCIIHNLRVHKPHENVNSESESFVVPDLPDKITLKRSQVSEYLKTKTGLGDYFEQIYEAEKRSYGLVNDSFYEIEPAYVDHLKKIKDTKVWHIGPLFQFFVGEARDNGVSDKHGCLSWLDDQKPKSVIYACFGSLVKFPEAQITEIALALEESKQPFIWVVGKAGIGGLPDGYGERIKSKNIGMVITGWAPQVEILQHPSVGGFLTHCGWNSMLEAMVFGVPVITWPFFADQYNNEKLVERLGIGVGVGADVCNLSCYTASQIIGKRGIREAIELLTGESVVAERIRQNSKELAIKAKKVVQEGGSSVNDITALIAELKHLKLTPRS